MPKDPLKLALDDLWKSHSTLESVEGPFTDFNPNGAGALPWCRRTAVPGTAFRRFMGSNTAVNQAAFRWTVFCETEEFADEVLKALTDTMDKAPLDVTHGRFLHRARIGQPIVSFYEGGKGQDQNESVWVATGAWVFTLQTVLGDS